MFVYLVYAVYEDAEDWGDYGVVAVFGSRELAEDSVRESNYQHSSIESWEVRNN